MLNQIKNKKEKNKKRKNKKTKKQKKEKYNNVFFLLIKNDYNKKMIIIKK